MSNHFHLLVEVPSRPPDGMSEAALLDIIRSCFGHEYALQVESDINECRQIGDEAGVQHIVDGWLNRMWDISAFMKALKQRFTQWYNSRNDRVGTLWECRFKSAIIQSGHALITVATYIDLNPVRAKLVSDPKDYRWCSYGAAIGGVRAAFQGIQRVVSLALEWTNFETKGREALDQYRVLLYLSSESNTKVKGALCRSVLPCEEAVKVEKCKGILTRAEMLRCRVRYFVDGAVIGSRAFVDEVFNSYRERFGPQRKTGARAMKGAEFGDLYSLRDLQKRVIESK